MIGTFWIILGIQLDIFYFNCLGLVNLRNITMKIFEEIDNSTRNQVLLN